MPKVQCVPPIDPEALEIMRQRTLPSTRWAAYQNQVLDSATSGEVQFLAIGPRHTYPEPPPQYPADTSKGLGWKFRFIGWVNLETGEVET